MEPLFIDDFLREQGFETTEDYLTWCKDGRAVPLFKGAEYFHSLFENGIIRPFVSHVRTQYTGGFDHSYAVIEDGLLEGMDLRAHSGKEGIHKAEDILSLEAAPDGWDIEGFTWPQELIELLNKY